MKIRPGQESIFGEPLPFKEMMKLRESPPPRIPQNLVDMAVEKQLPSFTGDADFDEMIRMCIKTLAVKGDDYTIGSKDRLHNFKTVSSMVGITPEEALGTYFYKHVAAVLNYVKSKGQSESEPIEGRIMDVINYMLLMYKMVKERERGNIK